MRGLLPWCLAAAVVAGVGCSGGGADGTPPASCFVGDPAAAPELALVYRGGDGAINPVVDGAPAPLFRPPQGGEVLFIGARARNIDGCPLTLSSSLTVPGTSVVAAFERRPVTLELGPDGWLQPKNPAGLGNFSNLPSCPIAGLGRAVDGESYLLTLEVEDLAGRKAQASSTVVPTCDLDVDPARCRCLCAAGYVLGSVCP